MISGNTLDGENMSWKEYKSKLFGLELRDKIHYNYPKRIQKIISSIHRSRSFKTGIRLKRNEILNIFKPYLI